MQKGFSLLELLLVLVVVATLLVVLLPKYTKTVQQQHKTQMGAIEQVRALQQTLNAQQQVRQRQMDRLGTGL